MGLSLLAAELPGGGGCPPPPRARIPPTTASPSPCACTAAGGPCCDKTNKAIAATKTTNATAARTADATMTSDDVPQDDLWLLLIIPAVLVVAVCISLAVYYRVRNRNKSAQRVSSGSASGELTKSNSTSMRDAHSERVSHSQYDILPVSTFASSLHPNNHYDAPHLPL